MYTIRLLSLIILLLALLVACGDGPDTAVTGQSATGSGSVQLNTPTPQAAPATAVASADTAAAGAPAGAVASLSDVRSATVRVGFEGSFLHYEYGDVENLPNHGSGFIIDPSGIAVTNNHVVTGAAFLEVQLEGEDTPRNARVLGVSECSDLAVIDIDGDGFPYLAWYEGPVSAGMDVYAAGFPLYGNTEYTLTRGVISKENYAAEFHWSSVDKVYEIDANIQGGNSGGPLVTPDGQVIGVNYAGDNETRQGFTIAREAALPVIAQLRQGQDVHSIGVNGEAVSDGESLFGIWVSSVESGSPADRAGVRPGDIITHLEGLQLATDGSMSAYCDILRSHNPGDKLRIRVFRYLTGEELEGQLNGDPLAGETPATTTSSTTAAPAPAAQPTAVPQPPASAADQPPYGNPNEGYVSINLALNGRVPDADLYADYTAVSDDSGILAFDAPAAWGYRTSSLEYGGFAGAGVSMVIGPIDPAMLTPQDNDVPVFVFYTRAHDPATGDSPGGSFNNGLRERCDAFEEPQRYNNEQLVGYFQVFTRCNGNEGFLVNVEVVTKDGVANVGITAQIGSFADLVALDRILNSLTVTSG